MILSRRLQIKLKSGNLYDNISIVSAAKKRALHRLFQVLYDIKSPKLYSKTTHSSRLEHKPKSKKKNCAAKKSDNQILDKVNVSNSVFSLSKIINELEPISKIFSNCTSKRTPKKKNIKVTSCEKKRDTPVFYIKVDGKCDASGYYNELDDHFYIKQGSLVSCTFGTLLVESPVKPFWKKFIDDNCTLRGSFYVVKHDVKLPKASLAATLVLGRSANNTYWQDKNGLFLKDYYADRFAQTAL